MLKELNPLLHSQLRLAIMSILLSVEEAEFVYIKEQTNSTAGNLSIQLEKLSEAGYIEVEKSFIGKKPRTVCRMTEVGRSAMEEYLDALKGYFANL
ncbi:MAG: transcriptional regulator [Phocaeicola sp.]|nr:transcriptional regulator [Phocaeicola sp.]